MQNRFSMFNEAYIVNHLRDILDYSCKLLVFNYSYWCKGPQNALGFTLNEMRWLKLLGRTILGLFSNYYSAEYCTNFSPEPFLTLSYCGLTTSSSRGSYCGLTTSSSRGKLLWPDHVVVEGLVTVA